MLKSNEFSFSSKVVDSDSGRSLWGVVTMAGHDLVVVIGGGDRPHIGSMVMAQPCGPGREPSCSVVTIPPHKEEVMARSVAARLTSEFQCVAVVTAGVHEDDLDRAGIEDFLALAARLEDQLVQVVKDLRDRPGHRLGGPVTT